MRGRRLLAGVFGAAGWMAVSSGLFAQPTEVKASDALVDVLVWGADLPIDPGAYAPAVRVELERLLRRSRAYRSQRASTATSGVWAMVNTARVRYERKLVAVSGDPRAAALAAAYVESLHPCYEWEGFHECPANEAAFAVDYQAAHPGGPFSNYLPLLAAHRWLCAAESYEFEKQAEGAAHSRREYEKSIATARQSSDLLIRTAAEGLMARGSCFPRR